MSRVTAERGKTEATERAGNEPCVTHSNIYPVDRTADDAPVSRVTCDRSAPVACTARRRWFADGDAPEGSGAMGVGVSKRASPSAASSASETSAFSASAASDWISSATVRCALAVISSHAPGSTSCGDTTPSSRSLMSTVDVTCCRKSRVGALARIHALSRFSKGDEQPVAGLAVS